MLALVLALISTPVLLKHHRPLLFLFWNTTAVIFILPGRPQVWIIMALISFGIVILQKTLLRGFKFLEVRPVVLPVAFIALVVFATAAFRGVGLQSFGDSVGGARRYITMFAAIAGFLAIVSARIPAHRAGMYVAFFFLGSLMNAIGSLVQWVHPAFYWVFLVFPVDMLPGQTEDTVWRSYGTTVAALGLYLYLLARYGLKEILFNKPWILLLLLGATGFSMLGGYRSFFVLIAVTGFWLAFIERLFTSRYALALLLATVFAGALLVPVTDKLPVSIQRTISILPVQVSNDAQESARVSTEWRLKMWEMLLPEIPRYFWLGKGLAIEIQDFETTRAITRGNVNRAQEAAIMAGDYHNGPLTVLINFGIWGALGWLWFLYASVQALLNNFRYGEDSLRKINALLLAYLLGRIVVYFLVFGNFYTDLPSFLGIVGFSLALNGGIARYRAAEPGPRGYGLVGERRAVSSQA
jgi:hypothetical protein